MYRQAPSGRDDQERWCDAAPLEPGGVHKLSGAEGRTGWQKWSNRTEGSPRPWPRGGYRAWALEAARVPAVPRAIQRAGESCRWTLIPRQHDHFLTSWALRSRRLRAGVCWSGEADAMPRDRGASPLLQPARTVGGRLVGDALSQFGPHVPSIRAARACIASFTVPLSCRSSAISIPWDREARSNECARPGWGSTGALPLSRPGSGRGRVLGGRWRTW